MSTAPPAVRPATRSGRSDDGRYSASQVRTGKGPAWLTFSPDGKHCCVSNVLGDDVSILDAAKRQEVARIKVGKMPKRLVVAGVPK